MLNTAFIQGEYEMKSGIITGRAFENSALDIYTGAVSFLVEEGLHARLLTGKVLPTKDLQLIWPGASIYSVSMHDYHPYTYRRVSSP